MAQSQSHASSSSMSNAVVAYRKIIQIAVPFAAALVAISASRVPSQAEANHILVIPATDGYGFEDCLSGNKSCGHTIADAWCEAHGMAASVSFGRAEDITASIREGKSLADTKAPKTGNATAMKLEPGSFIVDCRD